MYKRQSLAAIQAAVPLSAWALLVANLFWVLAYDTEYAMVDRNDDLKIGIRTSAITLGRFDVLGVMSFYAICLACWYMAGHEAGRGWLFNLGLLAAAAQAMWHGWLIKGRERMACFQAFRLNHWLGLTVWLGLVLDTWLLPRL